MKVMHSLEEAGIMRTEMNIKGNTGWFKPFLKLYGLKNTDIKMSSLRSVTT